MAGDNSNSASSLENSNEPSNRQSEMTSGSANSSSNLENSDELSQHQSEMTSESADSVSKPKNLDEPSKGQSDITSEATNSDMPSAKPEAEGIKPNDQTKIKSESPQNLPPPATHHDIAQDTEYLVTPKTEPDDNENRPTQWNGQERFEEELAVVLAPDTSKSGHDEDKLVSSGLPKASDEDSLFLPEMHDHNALASVFSESEDQSTTDGEFEDDDEGDASDAEVDAQDDLHDGLEDDPADEDYQDMNASDSEHDEPSKNPASKMRKTNDGSGYPVTGSDDYFDAAHLAQSQDAEMTEASPNPSKVSKVKTKVGMTKTTKAKAKGSSKAKRKRKLPKFGEEEAQLLDGIVDICHRANPFYDFLRNDAKGEQLKYDDGITRKDKALQSYRKEASAEERRDAKRLDQALKRFTIRGACKPDKNGQWLLKGMNSSLAPYQVVGAGMMRSYEARTNGQPRGGLLADEMGLGKTVMMLADVVNGRNVKDGEENKRTKKRPPTLIVVPSHLVAQWIHEIGKHLTAEGRGAVFAYCATGRPMVPDGDLEGFLLAQDIIVTTYHEISNSFPIFSKPSDVESDETLKADFDEKKGVFHRITFHRIILDEAQQIRNHETRISVACRLLKAQHRWALSGTPVLNGLFEFYAYFRFLGIEIGTFKQFKKWLDPRTGENGVESLTKTMSKWTIRRTHRHTFMGRKLLNLPLPDQKNLYLHLSPLEAQIYLVVEARFRARLMEAHGLDGNLDFNEVKKMKQENRCSKAAYNCFLTLLLRLQQLCVHPLLIQDCMKDLLEEEDYKKLYHILNNTVVGQNRALIHQLCSMLSNRDNLTQLDYLSNPSPSESVTTSLDEEVINGGSAESPGDISGWLKDLQLGEQDEGFEDNKCTWMSGKKKPHKLQNPFTTSCGHTYCWLCMQMLCRAAKADNRERKCMAEDCDTVLMGINAAEKNPQTAKDNAHKKSKGPAQIINTWVDGSGNQILSTKTIAVKSQVLNWLQKDRDVKILIYTRFVSVIQILSSICENEKWGYVQYCGKATQKKRLHSIEKFRNDPNCNIMLASLQAGGEGLNLTMASRVIIVEPWWNSAKEAQAFCRVFRRGQEQKTELLRLLTRDTVEERVEKIQVRKDSEIGPVMGEDTHKVKKASTLEMQYVFGATSQPPTNETGTAGASSQSKT